MILVPVLLASACVAVEGERILVGDLAGAVPEFSSAPAAEEIGLSPAPGVRRILGRAEIERLGKRFGVAVPPGAGACFERAGAPLEEDRVKTALARALEGAGAWTLVDFCRYRAPRGELEFTAPAARPTSAPVLVRGRIRYAENRSYPVWARVRIETPPREVERGDLVAVEVSSGAAVLKFEARAESGGSAGQDVTVRNPVTKKCFSARVAAQGRVLLNATQSSRQIGGGAGRRGAGEPGR
ncbi:MAG: flagella basal body P-ring formation protein FlgA [Acidobacteriota bacterium]